MCVIMKLYNMFTFTTVCNLDCNNHGNATSDCLKCTCDPNWGESTCSGMYVKKKKKKKKGKYVFTEWSCFVSITLLSLRHIMFSLLHL